MNPRLHKSDGRGFTLVEILIGMGILGLLTVGLLTFFIQSSTSFFVTEQKLKVNNDIRKFTSEMADHAREANHYIIYSTYAAVDRDSEEDRKRDGESGDFMVLIFYDNPVGTAPLISRPIRRVVGYYRASSNPLDPSSEGPVRKFDSDLDAWGVTFPIDQPIEKVLPSAAQVANFKRVIELSKGLANQRLFYNFHNRSIMVKGEILHGNAVKRVSNTYNFTISPRG